MGKNIKIYDPEHLFDEKSMEELEAELIKSITGGKTIGLLDGEDQLDEIHSLTRPDSNEEWRRITNRLWENKAFGVPGNDSFEKLDQLLDKNPIASDLVNAVKGQVSLFLHAEQKINFRMKPILVVGKPGIGKTFTIERIAKCLGMNSFKIDVSAAREAMLLLGTARGYNTATPGEVARQLALSPIANPVMILDEIDKAIYEGTFGQPLTAPLLALLERDTASDFFDACLRLNINCSHISWLATANEIERIPKPILSRFRVMYFKEPTIAHMQKIIASVSRQVLRDEGYTDLWIEATPEFLSNCSVVSGRDMTHIIGASLTRQINTLTATRTIVLEMGDLMPFLKLVEKKRSIGFIQ